MKKNISARIRLIHKGSRRITLPRGRKLPRKQKRAMMRVRK